MFFCKEKTANEELRSLVGKEKYIKNRYGKTKHFSPGSPQSIVKLSISALEAPKVLKNKAFKPRKHPKYCKTKHFGPVSTQHIVKQSI